MSDTPPEPPAPSRAGVEPPAPVRCCANCGATAGERFCPRCGQSQKPPDLTLRGLLRELVFELANADGRLQRTAGVLLLRPARYALDYFEGRGQRHMPPVRTFLIATVLLFLVLPVFETDATFKAERGHVRDDVRASSDAFSLQTGHPEFDLLMHRLNAQLDRFANEPERFVEEVRALVPQLGFVLLPFLALGLRVLFATPGMRYGHHLVVAVALQSSVFAWLIVAGAVLGLAGLARQLGAETLGGIIAWPVNWLPWLLIVGVALGLRQVYGRGWPGTVMRLLVLSLAYVLLTAVGFVLTFAFAFLVF